MEATARSTVAVRVHYPLERGELSLRGDVDWERDLRPVRARPAQGCFDFRLPVRDSHALFKPVLHGDGGAIWAQGENRIALAGGTGPVEVWPYFDVDERCHVCDRHTPPSRTAESRHDVRVYLPPGYGENSLQRYPVAYMHDGHNLFFPEESFGGETWRVEETLRVLDQMALIRQVIVVGIIPRDRNREYTAPGYEEYGHYLAEDLKPWVDAHYRTLSAPEDTLVMGSSLGGVASLHLAWSHPERFGNAACLSSTFGYADDLSTRVRQERKPPIRVYLDSGWPHDNFETTRSMHGELLRCGFVAGRDLHYLAFPRAAHDERSWALRAHIPFQTFFGQDHRGGNRGSRRASPARRQGSARR